MSESANATVIESFKVSPRYSINKIIGYGTYGIVVEALDTQTDELVAIKKLHSIEDTIDIKRTLRELKIMRLARHDSILSLKTVLHDQRDPGALGQIYLITPLLDSDLHRILESTQPLTNDQIQYFIYHLLRAVKYLHSDNIVHRDIKPNNILVNQDCSIALGDFGLSRKIDDGLQDLTEYTVARNYRAPEIMLSSHMYDKRVDIWSIGCVMGELFKKEVLFPGKNYVNQIVLIFQNLGTPCEQDLAFVTNPHAKDFISAIEHYPGTTMRELIGEGAGEEALDLLKRMLCINPLRRTTIEEALAHRYFEDLRDPDDEPTAVNWIDFSYENEDLSFEQAKTLLLEELVLAVQLNN